MRALVTGANGFIGSHLVDHLLAGGHETVAMVRPTANLTNLEEASSAEIAKVTLDDVEGMRAALRGVEVLFHVAGRLSGRTREEFEHDNVTGTANLIEAARTATNGPGRVVLVSSTMAAGPSHPDMPRREEHIPREGATLYGDSKLRAERLAWRAAQSGEIEFVIVRPPTVYGPRDRGVLQIIRGAASHIVGQPGFVAHPHSCIHVGDLGRGILEAALQGPPLPRGVAHSLDGRGVPDDAAAEPTSYAAGTGIYYLTDGARHTLASIGQVAARALGVRALTIPLPGWCVLSVAAINETIARWRGVWPALTVDKARGGLAGSWYCDDTRARREFGFSSPTDIETGMAATVAWLREHRQL